MQGDGLFLKEHETYQRSINPVSQYVHQAAIYLSKMTQHPYEQCREWVSSMLKNNQTYPIRNPTIEYFERGDNGDRYKDSSGLHEYIQTMVQEKWVTAPTFTCYLPVEQKKSRLVDFVDNNKKRRSVSKKQSQAAKAEGNLPLAISKDNEQKLMKKYNNSLSGAFGSNGTIFCNPTAHNSLTSTIRSVSSFGNASNERVVMGNRHFFSEELILANLNCICAEMDRTEVQQTMNMFKLRIPSIDEVMECIHYSSKLYFSNPLALVRLRTYVERMDDMERAAFCYTGDLYRLRILNDDFMRDFISQLSRKCDGDYEEASKNIRSINEDVLNFAHQICYDSVRGKGKSYEKMDPATVSLVYHTSKNIISVIEAYHPFIKAFFLSKMIPASHANIPTMMRRSVVLSDTDSTCFSTDDWMQWYFGKVYFSEETFAVCGAVAFIATQAVAHILAILSANINVERKKLHDLAMKNEYVWTVHMPTNVAKHYAALTVMQEGSVYKEPSLEIKGVHLKNSAAPPELIKRAHLMVTEILTTIANNKPFYLREYYLQVLEIEKNIMASMRRGEVTYYKRSKVKNAEAYSLPPEKSNYQHYQFWIDVMQDRHGRIDPPPYDVVVVPTNMQNKTAVQNWLDNMEDREQAERYTKWLVKTGKKEVNTFYLPLTWVTANGIPNELRPIVNVEKITLNLTLVFRIILESIGFFPKSDVLLSQYEV